MQVYYNGNTNFPLHCWKNGHDVRKEGPHLGCDTSVKRSVVNAANFLYSTLLPTGSYLESCSGVFRTIEIIDGRERSFLYASCEKSSGTQEGFVLNTSIATSRLDITDCSPGKITNSDGYLQCMEQRSTPRSIVTGSYLKYCFAANSRFDSSKDTLTAECGGMKQYHTLEGLSNCLSSGGDVVFDNTGLACDIETSKTSEIHTASDYIPPGNYSLSCTDMAYYPCAGKNRKGLLTAKCFTNNSDPTDLINSTFLENADQACSAASYVSNVNGTLQCDPDTPSVNDPARKSMFDRLSCSESN